MGDTMNIKQRSPNYRPESLSNQSTHCLLRVFCAPQALQVFGAQQGHLAPSSLGVSRLFYGMCRLVNGLNRLVDGINWVSQALFSGIVYSERSEHY